MNTVEDVFKGWLDVRIPHCVVIPVYSVLDLYFYSNKMYVYLIHLSEPITRSNGYQVRHYIGSTDNLDRRLRQHLQSHPCFRLSDGDLERCCSSEVAEGLKGLVGKTFRRHHTFVSAIEAVLPGLSENKIRIIKRAAKKSNGSPLLMEARRRGISWWVSKAWKANRLFEKYLKSRGHYEDWCPLCGDDIPF